MITKDDRRLRVGVLGCGPIAQFAHLESCAKARNADLFAICDAAPDLLARMGATYAVPQTYADYDAMLADPDVEAVIVATSDAFHVPMSIRALEAGKAVLCEKPIGVSVGEVEELRERGRAHRSGPPGRAHEALRSRARGGARLHPDRDRPAAGAQGLVLRQHPPLQHDRRGAAAAITSRQARRPEGEPKADLRRYYMLAHGSHLVDTARFLCGEITEVRARLAERFGAYCWFVETSFANGTLGHLDLTVAVRMDWHEGFQLYGEHGSILAKTYNPWYYRSSDVEIFPEKDATWRRPLGADGHFFRRQLKASRQPCSRCADAGCRHRGRAGIGPRHGGDRGIGAQRAGGAGGGHAGAV